MAKSPILTIAIPTYNRVEPLRQIILQLASEDPDTFNILISDDSSIDEIGEMIREYQKSMRNLIYHRNSKNLGFSRNVFKLYELTKTKYVWFLCDDDTVLPGAVGKILSAINKYHFVVGVFNCSWIDSYGVKRTAGVKTDKVYSSLKSFSQYDALLRTTFLSIVVLEKRPLVSELKQKNYNDNIFFQVTLALILLSDKFIFCEISSLILHRNVGYKYGEFFKFYLIDLLKAITIVKHKFDNKIFFNWANRHLMTALQLYLSQKIGLFKYYGSPTHKTLRKIIHYYGPYCVFIALFKPIYIITPIFLIKFLYFIRLVELYGYKKARIVYSKNINRAYTDERKTGFINYK